MKISVALEVESDDPLIAIEFLLENIQLSKSRLKKLMNGGGVWLRRGDTPRYRLRRAMTDLKVGDVLEIFYDETLLDQPHRSSTCVADHDIYSIWNKPAGVFCNGSDWGDHNSLERQVILHFHKQRPVWLAHWLPAAGRGLILVSHHKRARGTLDELQKVGGIKATYRIEVEGDQRWLSEDPMHPALKTALTVSELSYVDVQVTKYNRQVGTTSIQLLVSCLDMTDIIAWCRSLDLIFAAVGENISAFDLSEDMATSGREPMNDYQRQEQDQNQEEDEHQGELITLVPIDLIKLSFLCPFTGELRTYKV